MTLHPPTSSLRARLSSSMRFSLGPGPLVFAALLAACGSNPTSRSTPTPSPSITSADPITKTAPTPCDVAGGLRARAISNHAVGQLDRTVRGIDRADELCPASAHESSVL